MKKKKLTLNDVLEANLLVRERGSGTRTAVERLLREAGHPLEFGSEVSSNEAIKRMVSAGLGIPITMLLTDPGVTGARATAETLDEPTQLEFGVRRGLWKAVMAFFAAIFPRR